MKRIHILIILLLASAEASSGITAEIMLPYYRKQAENTRLPIGDRLDCYDSLLRYTNIANERRRVLIEMGELCFNTGMLRRATEVYDELSKDLSESTQSEKCKILYAVARTHIFCSDTHRSTDAIRQLRAIDKVDSLKYYDALAELAEGVVREKNRRIDLMMKNIDSGMAILAATARHYPAWKADDIRAQLLILRARIHHAAGDYENELKVLGEAEKISKSDAIRQLVNMNRGVIYENLGRYDVAETFFSNILDSSPLMHVNTGLVVVNYLGLLARMERPDDALKIYSANRKYADLLKGSQEEGFIHANLANVYALKGDYAQAYGQLMRYVDICDSISRSQDKMLAVSAREEQQRNALREKSTQRRMRTWRLVAAAGLLAALGLAAMCVVQARRRKREQSELKQALERLRGEKEEAIDRLNEPDEAKNRELTALALKISHYDESVRAIRREIDDPALDKDGKLEAVRRSLRDVKLQDDAWEMFDTYFAGTHGKFLTRLCAKHPSLTPGELRMCAFVALNLGTKDIAAITNRSTRTVETTKYRINKKLGCDEPLGVYLRSLMSPGD